MEAVNETSLSTTPPEGSRTVSRHMASGGWMDGIMSPQQNSLGRGGGQHQYARRRQSAPSLVISKALTRSMTLSRESFLVPLCPETCPLVLSFLAAADRSLVLHGHAQLKTGMQTQDRHLFLFTDMLVAAKAKSANHFKLKAQARLCEMWTAGCMDEVCEGSTNPERSFVVGWPTCNYVASFGSEEQKEKWLSLLKSRMKEEKEREEPKTIPLRVYGKGINAFAVTKTLPVSNSDSTNEVIRLALQQFSIIGNVKDYQLWVISKRDNIPYPLIGHELPFSIQMSHVRSAASHGAGGGRGDAAAPPAGRQGEQLQVCKQCQFILRPRPIQPLHFPAEVSRKPFKRRRSLMTWAFWRGSSSHLSELPPSAARGRLFGQPLTSVCAEDTLPKPVMEMLSFLYSEGSWTRGIFRRPAGARAVRELRDSLDNGEFQLPLTRDHVYVIAGVFKDFLRSIPGGLLCCELHEEWMYMLREEEEEEVQDIQRMIRRLPKENALLLRYLLAMLHGIQGNARENLMTSLNLSVCIAPSLLWPPSAPCCPELEGEGTKKVCELVKFMIEHCRQILGEDPSSLFGGPPQRLNADETEPESWLYPLTDSSYDGLEKELDNSTGGSPGLCSRRRRRTKPLQGSLDSILAFRDGDQDPNPGTHQKQTDRPYDLKLPPLEGGRRPYADFSSPGQDTPNVDASDSLSPDGQQRQRWHSEGAGGDGSRAHGKLVPEQGQAGERRGSHTSCRTSKDGGPVRGRPGQEPHKGRQLQQDSSSSPPPHHRSTESHQRLKCFHSSDSLLTAKQLCDDRANAGGGTTNHRSTAGSRGNELRQPPPFLFYKPSGPSLSLFRKNEFHSEEEEQCNTRLNLRRLSEPERRLMDRASTLTWKRQPSDPGLKVTELDSQGGVTDPRFCLSPYSTKAVRDYFSPRPRSNPQSSQQVALALVESHREWLKRYSDPTAEADLDQLLFAEESYV